MCITEYIAYTCGHRSISVLRACPMTTHLHTNPVCPIAREPSSLNSYSSTSCQVEGNPNTTTQIYDDTCRSNASDSDYTSTRTSATARAFFAKTMCSPCGRIMHANWVNIMEYEHRWMHERGVCGCPVKFPALMGPRVVGAGGFFENTGKRHDHIQQERTEHDSSTTSTGRSGIAPLFAEHEDPHCHHHNKHAQYRRHADQINYIESGKSNLQVSVRLPSLYAAEWVNDHRARHDSGQCHCLVSFDEYEPATFEEAELRKKGTAKIEQVDDFEADNMSVKSPLRRERPQSAGKEQNTRSEKSCSDNSRPPYDTRTEYLQAADGDHVECFIPFQFQYPQTREPSVASSSPTEAPRETRRSTAFDGPGRESFSTLKSDQVAALSIAPCTPSPTSKSTLSEQYRHKPSKVPQSWPVRTPSQTALSSHSDQESNDRSMYFMERIIGPPELIRPVAYDDTLAPYTYANYSSFSEGFVEGINKSTRHYQPVSQGKCGEGKFILQTPFKPSSMYEARHAEGYLNLNQPKSHEHNPHTYKNQQNKPMPCYQGFQSLPIAGFPIGAGPENDSHAADYELCRLKLQAYNLPR